MSHPLAHMMYDHDDEQGQQLSQPNLEGRESMGSPEPTASFEQLVRSHYARTHSPIEAEHDDLMSIGPEELEDFIKSTAVAHQEAIRQAVEAEGPRYLRAVIKSRAESSPDMTLAEYWERGFNLKPQLGAANLTPGDQS